MLKVFTFSTYGRPKGNEMKETQSICTPTTDSDKLNLVLGSEKKEPTDF